VLLYLQGRNDYSGITTHASLPPWYASVVTTCFLSFQSKSPKEPLPVQRIRYKTINLTLTATTTDCKNIKKEKENNDLAAGVVWMIRSVMEFFFSLKFFPNYKTQSKKFGGGGPQKHDVTAPGFVQERHESYFIRIQLK